MSFGFWQIILIVLVFLILFGGNRLPSAMADLAKGLKNFRNELKDEEEGADDATAETPRVIEHKTESSSSSKGKKKSKKTGA